MRKFAMLSAVLLALSACTNKDDCSQISCEPCAPTQSQSQVILELDSLHFSKDETDTFLIRIINTVAKDTLLAAKTNNTYRIRLGTLLQSQQPLHYEYIISNTQGSFLSRISSVYLNSKAGEGCCGCPSENIVAVTVNGTTYTSAELPVPVTK